jgi:DNA processing protein
MTGACADCLRRPWLLRALAGHLDPVRSEISQILSLNDEDLVAAVGGRKRRELARRLANLDPAELRHEAERAHTSAICRCHPFYPEHLRDLPNPPAVLFVAGKLERFFVAAVGENVAIVGSRRTSSYGIDMARSLGRRLAASGLPVISGMAMGIDSAAHQGALAAQPAAAHLATEPPTLAVLPGPAHEPYPRSARALHRRLLATSVAISEIPPDTPVRAWMFLARNRIIAGLAAMTIVVEAGERSGALLTAHFAAELGRPVGAVPGRVTTAQAAGPNRLLAHGAHVITGAQDVLDLVFEAGTRIACTDARPKLSGAPLALLQAIEAGHDTAGALVRAGIVSDPPLGALAELELEGYVRRGAGGRFTVTP